MVPESSQRAENRAVCQKAENRAVCQKTENRTGDADDSSSFEDDDSLDFAQPEIAAVPVVANDSHERPVV